MGWFERVKKVSAAERVTGSDKPHAMNTWQELDAISAERERMLREGVTGSAPAHQGRRHGAGVC